MWVLGIHGSWMQVPEKAEEEVELSEAEIVGDWELPSKNARKETWVHYKSIIQG